MRFLIVFFITLSCVAQDLKVIPTNNTVTPQDFGYVENTSIEQFYNDATPYIQACLDSKYNVYIPPGYYYITRPLKVHFSKTITMVGRYNRLRIKYSKDEPYLPNKTVIYTNKEIDFWHIYEGFTVLQGGTLVAKAVKKPKNVSFVKVFYKDAFQQYSSIDDVTFLCEEQELKGQDQGYIGVSFDSTTDYPKPNYPRIVGKGECHYLNVNVRAYYLHTVYLQNGTRPNSRNVVNVEEFGCKKAVDIQRGGGVKITGWGHTRYVLTKKEKDYAKITLNSGGNDVDWAHIEVTPPDPKGQWYPHQIAYENNEKTNWLSGGGRNYWNIYRQGVMIKGKYKFMNQDFLYDLYREARKQPPIAGEEQE